MPLPAELDRKYRNRFDELIGELETLLENLDEYSEDHALRFEGWVVKCSALLVMVFSESNQGDKYVHFVERNHGPGFVVVGGGPHKTIYVSSVASTLVTLRAIKDNYIHGFYDSLSQTIVSNVTADYMEQAEALLGEGIVGQYDHVPAAVLCGAVLEDALRRLCQKQTPPIDIFKSKGDKKTMGPLIRDLQKEKVFNKLVANDLQGWAKIRNYAAHGEFAEFTREQVDLMLPGVRQFLTNHL